MPPPPPALSAALTTLPAGRSAAPALATPSTSSPTESTTALHTPAAPAPLAPLPARRGHYVTRAAVLRDVHRPTLQTTSPHVAVGGGSVLPVGRAPDLASGRARSSGSLAAAAATVLARDSTANLAPNPAAPVPVDRTASTVRFSEDALFRGNVSWTQLAVGSAVALAGGDGVSTGTVVGKPPAAAAAAAAGAPVVARARARKPAPTRLASIPRARRTSLPDSCELRPRMAVHGQTAPTVFASMHALDAGRGVPRTESTPGNALGSSFSILAEIPRQADASSSVVSQSDPGAASAATGREFGGGVVHITLDHASSTPVLTPATPESPPVHDQCPVILEEAAPASRGRSAARTRTGSASPHRPPSASSHRPPSASPARPPSATPTAAAPPGPDLYLGTSPPRASSARPGSARPGSRPPTRPRSPMRPILAGADAPPPLTGFEVQATPLRRPSASDDSQPGSPASPRMRRATEPALATGLTPPDWTVTGTAPPTARQRSSTVPDGAPPPIPPPRPTTARSIPASPVPPEELAGSVLINHRPSVVDPAAVARASIADPPPPPVKGLHRFAVIVTKSFGHAMTTTAGAARGPVRAPVVAGTRIVQQPGAVPIPTRGGGAGGGVGMLESVGLTVTKMPVAPPPMTISMIARPVPAAPPPPPPPARKTTVPPVVPAPAPAKPAADSAVDGLKASKIAVPPPRPSSPARRPVPKPDPAAAVPAAPLKSILKKPVPAKPEPVPEAKVVQEPVSEPELPAEPVVEEGEGTVVEVDVLPEQDPMEAAVNALVEKLSPRLLATEHIQRFNFVNDYTRLLRRHEDLMQKNLVNNNISTLDVDTRYIEPLSEDQLMTMVWNMYFFVYSLGTKFVLSQPMQQAIKKCIESDESDAVKVNQLCDMFGKLSKSERMNYKAVIGHCFR
ncbi:hypothetical protein GGF32_003219, partial [Allomyces javanicus]